jgi:ankyrin repeat protein
MANKLETLADKIIRGLSIEEADLFTYEDFTTDSYGQYWLLQLALEHKRNNLISLIISHLSDLEYFPTNDPSRRKAMKYSANMGSTKTDIAFDEANLVKAFGPDVSFERPPLLLACRHGHKTAIEQLIQRGAKLGKKDLFGYSEIELCFASGGIGAVKVFLTICSANKKKPTITEPALELGLKNSDLLDNFLSVGKLNAAAQRTLFCWYCALLDVPRVTQMLDNGFDVNKSFTSDLNSLWQAITSSMLVDYENPLANPLSQHHFRATGRAENTSISIDNRLIDESGKNFNQLMKEAREQLKLQHQAIFQPEITQQEQARQNILRFELLNLLIASGLDIAKCEQKFPDYYVRELILLDDEALLSILLQAGFSLQADTDEFWGIPNELVSRYQTLTDQVGNSEISIENDSLTTKLPGLQAITSSPVQWELSGESVLFGSCEHTSKLVIQLTHSNIYGPDDTTTFSVRTAPLLNSKKNSTPWTTAECVEDVICVNNEFVNRAKLLETPYDETPWSGTYEAKLPVIETPFRIEIKIESKHSHPELLDDWIFND